MTQEIAAKLADYVREMIRQADSNTCNLAGHEISQNNLHMRNKHGHMFDVNLNYDDFEYGVSRVLYHCAQNNVFLDRVKMDVTLVQVDGSKDDSEKPVEGAVLTGKKLKA